MKKINLILFVLVTFAWAGCNTKQKESVGPLFCPSSNFNNADLLMNNVSNNLIVNFVTEDSVQFSASFNEKVKWTISITGDQSGAKVNMAGYSMSIDTAWYGLAEGGYLFDNEVCTVVYKVACMEAVTKKITISAKTDFASIPYYKLLTDFDGGGFFPSTTIAGLNSDNGKYNGSSNWSWYGNTAPDDVTYQFDFHVPKVLSASNDSVMPSPTGGKYLRMVGDRNIKGEPETYFFGGVYNEMNYLTNTGFAAGDVAQNTYINMWIKSTSNATNSQLQVTIASSSCDCQIAKLVTPSSNWTYVSWKVSDHEMYDLSNFKAFGIALGSAPGKGMTAVGYVDHISFSRVPFGTVIPK